MMFVYNKLIISTLTTHIKLKDVVKNINKKNFVYNKIYTLYNSLIRDFNIINPKIIIAGVNPHSGENGHLGTEEKKSIIPQMNTIQPFTNIRPPKYDDEISVYTTETTEGFTNFLPTIFCITSIIICLFCLAKAMMIIPVGFTYATYGGLTIIAVTIFGIVKYNQTPNTYAVIGIGLIIIGVIMVNYLGKINS